MDAFIETKSRYLYFEKEIFYNITSHGGGWVIEI